MIFNFTCADALRVMRDVNQESRKLIDKRQGPKLALEKELRQQIAAMPRETLAQQKAVVTAMCNPAACLLHADLDIGKLSSRKIAYLSSIDAIEAIARARDAGVSVDWKAFNNIPSQSIPAVTPDGRVDVADAAKRLHFALSHVAELPLKEGGGSSTLWNEIVKSGMFLGYRAAAQATFNSILCFEQFGGMRQMELGKMMKSLGAFTPEYAAQVLTPSPPLLNQERLSDLLAFPALLALPELHRACLLERVSDLVRHASTQRAHIHEMLDRAIVTLAPAHQGRMLSNLITSIRWLPEHERDTAYWNLMIYVGHLYRGPDHSKLLCDLATALEHLRPAEQERQTGRLLGMIQHHAPDDRTRPLITLAQAICHIGRGNVVKNCAAILSECRNMASESKGRVIAAMVDNLQFLESQAQREAVYRLLSKEGRTLPTDVRVAVLPNLILRCSQLGERAVKAHVPALWRMVKQSPVASHGDLLTFRLSAMGHSIAAPLSIRIARASETLSANDRERILTEFLHSLSMLDRRREVAGAALAILASLPEDRQREVATTSEHVIIRLSSSVGAFDDKTQMLLDKLRSHLNSNGVWSGNGAPVSPSAATGAFA